LIDLKVKGFVSIVKYYEYLDNLKDGKIHKIDIEGGGDRHLGLKLVGRDYLHTIGVVNVLYEKVFEGYIPDVISEDQKVIIECGNTNADKVFNYFKNKSLKELVVIPYSDDKSSKISLYIFTPSEELSEFLLFREIELGKIAISKRSHF